MSTDERREAYGTADYVATTLVHLRTLRERFADNDLREASTCWSARLRDAARRAGG